MIEMPADRPRGDAVLPAAVYNSAGFLQPEKRLMLAVLESAVGDFQKYATVPSGPGRRIFSEVDAWLESRSADRLLDFESICHALGLDPSFIRAGLGRWCAARRRDIRPASMTLDVPFRRAARASYKVAAAS
jgi:hypothetical protein